MSFLNNLNVKLDTAKNHYEYCQSSVVNFVMHWLGSALCLVSHFNKQSSVYDFMKVF